MSKSRNRWVLPDGVILSILPTGDRDLPKPLGKVAEAAKPGNDYVMVVNFNVDGENPPSERDAIKRRLFEDLKANGRVKSQGLWLGENNEHNVLIAYLEANQQSLMALTENGIINAKTEASLRSQYVKMVEGGFHGRE